MVAYHPVMVKLSSWVINNMPIFLIESDNDALALLELKRLYDIASRAERATMDKMSITMYGWGVIQLTTENEHDTI